MTVVLCAAMAMAEEPYPIAWTAQIGTAGSDYGRALAADASGNIYLTGSTEGDFGGPNAGHVDAFLAKLDASGNELWRRQMGTTRLDYGCSVAVDASGHSYVSGYTDGSLGGPNIWAYDAFLIKLDTAGNELWSRQIGTTSSDYGQAVAVDASGNAYVSGLTSGSLGGPNAGQTDAFLTKFDASGTELWSQQIGSTSSDRSNAVAVDAAGNAYISGATYGDVAGANEGLWDAFLAKFSPSGAELWSQQIGTTTYDRGFSVAVDAVGNAYISGETEGDLGGTNAGGIDTFLVKFDTSGNELWRNQVGTSAYDNNRSVTVDAAGNAFISGWTGGDIGGPNAGENDAFLTKFDASGAELWSQQVGSASGDHSYAITVDPSGNVFIGGGTDGDIGGSNAGAQDAFLVKLQGSEPIFDGSSAAFTNPLLGLRHVGDSYTLEGYGDFAGETRSWSITGKDTVLGVDCLTVRVYGHGAGLWAAEYYDVAMAQDLNGDLVALAMAGWNPDDGAVNWMAASVDEKLLMFAADPTAGTIYQEPDGSTEILATGVTVGLLPTGFGPFADCVSYLWQSDDDGEMDLSWRAPGWGEVKATWDDDGTSNGWYRSSPAVDVDGDGDYDADDIDALGDAIRLGLTGAAYDISGPGEDGVPDGIVDVNDMDYFIHFLVETTVGFGTEYGDFNLDGLVDATDLTRIGTYFGSYSSWAEGNANRHVDMIVDVTDLAILGTYFGFNAASDAIPEPATLGLLAMGGLAALRRRKK